MGSKGNSYEGVCTPYLISSESKECENLYVAVDCMKSDCAMKAFLR